MFPNLACWFAPSLTTLMAMCPAKRRGGKKKEKERETEKTLKPPNVCLSVCCIVQRAVKGAEKFPQTFQNTSLLMNLSCGLPYWLL